MASSSIAELILAMEEAILAAKQLPNSSSDPTRVHQIQASLARAHSQLSSFLTVPAGEEHSGEPMQVEGEDEPAKMVDGVEERLRQCFIHNKRPKRRLSPSMEGRHRSHEEGAVVSVGGGGFDPYATRLRSLELVYQFYS